MSEHDQPPDLEWRDGGVPVSRRFDDPYFSLAGGLDETRHVFLSGNDLQARIAEAGADVLHVVELGFGTGLNLLALAELADRPVRFKSFEAYPMDASQLAQAHTAFPDLAELSAQLRLGYGSRRFRVGQVQAELIVGDARQTLPLWNGMADAWFLDGFSPARNPELWGAELLAQVGALTRQGGTFATYSAAGHVRRALEAAGFEVHRSPGFAGKRHMSRGIRR
ncbi:tRNA U34 5-methylaminomethyl-2-thiouridine-forming methyltransferase MnmC [Paracoccus isoporae]|uniref:tRNA U34 5-methylaminomethyl-2-thiouridine-forming methyltransferase MnmC n=1 Tax=Paracoccus isoporae TaxID=591205 RepID=A0A1G6UGB9_9RHOB|nr:tRNA (5-methylaminomethyl-2-thiouridine)(34)-methyltransferase MnmD [Paracoccus isoporae]SDD40343.1 tRNA U34 5-methylaminomethyl-2-thiouridine-forming methyltransferase MnmC [Paracoccus isoporae]